MIHHLAQQPLDAGVEILADGLFDEGDVGGDLLFHGGEEGGDFGVVEIFSGILDIPNFFVYLLFHILSEITNDIVTLFCGKRFKRGCISDGLCQIHVLQSEKIRTNFLKLSILIIAEKAIRFELLQFLLQPFFISRGVLNCSAQGIKSGGDMF
ncbi:Protein NPHP-2, putative [Babesia ovata]|uniref:Protein NPHP-2, putative n=1 Tax=Babesia ovata TaxID=189622 RepID=A0A2H6KJM6_9APIC|nr:Protein NPHP-2, putative [Babesia ovata]GBE63180.1 Protein NPHP-2, putative [Babesia ovata]